MLVFTFWKVLLSFVPRPFIAVMAATAIRAAMRPYSIAVAALLFLMNFLMKCIAQSFSFFARPHGPQGRTSCDRQTRKEKLGNSLCRVPIPPQKWLSWH